MSSLRPSTVSLSKEMQVLQSPPELLTRGDDVKLQCTSKVHDHSTFLWYQRPKGETALKLIGYIYYKAPFIEPSFKDHFNFSVDGDNTAYLHILNPKHPEHTAEYFAAARSAPCWKQLVSLTKTVMIQLDTNIHDDTTEHLSPSTMPCLPHLNSHWREEPNPTLTISLSISLYHFGVQSLLVWKCV